MAEGFDSLYKKLQALGNVGNKIGNSVLKEEAEVVLDQQKKDAPRDKNSTDHGADNLAIDGIKSRKGTKSIGIGITQDNWEQCKGLYFQNFGFELWKDGQRIEPHVGWIDDSFEKVKDKVKEDMFNKINGEINKILE